MIAFPVQRMEQKTIRENIYKSVSQWEFTIE